MLLMALHAEHHAWQIEKIKQNYERTKVNG